MNYIRIGKIVNTHGIKGELRLISNFKYKDKIFKKDMPIYIGSTKIKEIIQSYRRHKQFDMITLFGYDNINLVLKYIGQYAYILRSDLNLNDDEYLDEDLIDFKVICEKREIGTVSKIEKYPHQDLIVVKSLQKEYLIPYVSDIILAIDFNKKEMTIKNIKGLI